MKKKFFGCVVVLGLMTLLFPVMASCADERAASPAALMAQAAPRASAAPKLPIHDANLLGMKPTVPKKAYTVGVLVPALRDPHWVNESYGCYDEGQRWGLKVILFEAGGYANLEKQISQMEDLIQRKVDGIILAPVNYEGTGPVVDETVKKGIPVINANNISKSNMVLAIVRNSDLEIGGVLAERIGEQLKGKGNVVMLSGPAGASWSMLRAEGFKKKLAEKYPGIKILAERWHDSDRAAAMKVMEDYMQTFPNIDYAYSPGDLVGQGAASAVQAAGKRGKIRVVSASFSPTAKKMVEEGLIDYYAGQQALLIGRWAMQTMIKILNGETVPKPPKEITVPISRVTKENVATIDTSTEWAPEGWTPPRL